MKKFFKHIKLTLKIKLNKPTNFSFLSPNEKCNPVGPELKVYHSFLSGMLEWECRWRLTEEVILNDLNANAIKVIRTENVENSYSLYKNTVFQPCKI